jgi:WD40 repeat protein
LVAAGKTLIAINRITVDKETSPTLPVLDYLPVSLPNTVTQAMTSTLSTQPAAAAAPKMIMPPVMALEGHVDEITSISYSPDGKQIVSGGSDQTTRRWDLQAGEEIEGARDVHEWVVLVMAISRDGRWVITAGGDEKRGVLRACEVETRMVKKIQGHSAFINCIDISQDSMLLASGSDDGTTQIWSLDTGKLVAGPFKSTHWVGAIRFSQDSKKLAINSHVGSCLEVWDVQTQKLDRRIGKYQRGHLTNAPVFWTNKETILAAFTLEVLDDSEPVAATTICEFDASTLETLGAPFQGHTKVIRGLALSFDGALLASTSEDNTIKLWAFESRQLLASLQVLNPRILALSPDSNQLAYTTHKYIIIFNLPPGILSSIGLAPEASVCIGPIYLSLMW